MTHPLAHAAAVNLEAVLERRRCARAVRAARERVRLAACAVEAARAGFEPVPPPGGR